MRSFFPIKPLVFLLGAALTGALPPQQALAGQATGKEGTLEIVSGNYHVSFIEKAAWTINKMSFAGKPVFSYTGAYGSVIKMNPPANLKEGEPRPDPWIGTGHGKEVIETLELAVDGKKVTVTPELKAQGENFVLTKTSRLGPMRHQSRITVSPEGLREDFDYELVEDGSKIQSMYAYMHCFPKSISEWAALPASGPVESGVFKSDNSWSLRKDIHWLAVYGGEIGTGLVLRYEQPYPGTKELTNSLWNRPHDNKSYFRPVFPRAKGSKFGFRLLVQGFQAAPAQWRQTVDNLVAKPFGPADLP